MGQTTTMMMSYRDRSGNHTACSQRKGRRKESPLVPNRRVAHLFLPFPNTLAASSSVPSFRFWVEVEDSLRLHDYYLNDSSLFPPLFPHFVFLGAEARSLEASQKLPLLSFLAFPFCPEFLHHHQNPPIIIVQIATACPSSRLLSGTL